MAALTKTTLYTRIRAMMGDNPWHDICTEAMDTTETGLDVADTTKYAIGNIVEFQDDGELCLVTALASATTLTVIRNFQLSVGNTAGTGTNHTISADITVDPAFSIIDITRELEGVITTLWPTVWITPTTTDTDGPILSFTPTAGEHWYDIGATQLSAWDIGNIEQVVYTSPVKKVVTYGDNGSYPVYRRHGLPTGIATNFTGLYFPNIHNYDNPIRVALISPITSLQTVAGTYDYLDDNTPAADTLMYMTCARLVLQKEVQRVTNEDVSMGEATVMGGTRLRSSAYLDALGQKSLMKWRLQCMAVWPRLPRGRFYKVDTEVGGRF